LVLAGVTEHVVGVLHLAEAKGVGDQLVRIEPTGLYGLYPQRRGIVVYQAGGDGDVMRPQALEVKFYALAVDAGVGDAAAGGDDVRAPTRATSRAYSRGPWR
jgi:hypothetical protein